MTQPPNNIQQSVPSSYDDQSNGQVEVCIKWTLKKCFSINVDTNITLLQIRSTSLGPEPPSLAMLFFSWPIVGIMLVTDKSPINVGNDDDHYEALVARKHKADKTYVTPREYNSIPTGSAVAVQWEDDGIIEKGDYNHKDWSYRICVTKMDGWSQGKGKHMNVMCFTAQQYLRDQRQTYTYKLVRGCFKALQNPSTTRQLYCPYRIKSRYTDTYPPIKWYHHM